MDRITKKDGKFYELKPEKEVYGWENGIRLVQIVGKLEDLEEELGCPLEVLFKALKNGVYTNEGFGFIAIEELSQIDGLGFSSANFDECYKISDYKKTWWLNKEDKSE